MIRSLILLFHRAMKNKTVFIHYGFLCNALLAHTQDSNEGFFFKFHIYQPLNLHDLTCKVESYSRPNVRWFLIHSWKFKGDCCKCGNKRNRSQSDALLVNISIQFCLWNLKHKLLITHKVKQYTVFTSSLEHPRNKLLGLNLSGNSLIHQETAPSFNNWL